jgi:predicted LPLAT superfamily acyltransferase
MSNFKWSGKTQGWGLGMKIFLSLIRAFGFLPVYILLVPVCLVYTVISVKAKIAIKQFRRNLGLSTNFFDYYAHFFSFSLTLVHKAGFLIRKADKIKYSTEGENRIKDVLEKGRGAILLASHVGNFGIAGEVLCERINTKVNVLAIERESESVKKIYEDADKNRKINIIPLEENSLETAIKIKDALQNGEIVATLGDRYIDGNVAEVEFLGKKAKFPRGMFEIAAVTQTPLIPVFMIRKKLHIYQFRTGEPIDITVQDRKKRAQEIDNAVRNFAFQIGEEAKKTPLQWYNYYRFWD